MDYNERIVAFIDILGFKNIITSDKYKAEGISHLLKYLRKQYTLDKYPHSEIVKPTLSFFSDNIFLSYSYSPENELNIYEDFIHRTSIMQAILFSFGILTRGAVTRGFAIHNEEECFGPAVVRAAELESKIAIYPRIICDKNLNIINILTESRFRDIIEETELDMYYINFFSFLMNEKLSPFRYVGDVSFFDIRSMLYKLLESSNESNIDYRPKQIWIIKQWNLFINAMITKFNIESDEYSGYIIKYDEDIPQ